jgi:PAS domain S-box-containing protein
MPQEKSCVSKDNIGFFSATVGNVSSFNNIDICKNVKCIEDFNNKIFNNLNIVTYVVDADLNILAASNEFVKLARSSVKKEKIVNSNLLNAFPYLKETNAELEYKRVFQTGDMFVSEEKIQHYGDTIYTSVSKIPIKDDNGKVKMVLTVIKDISELKKLKEEIDYLREESALNRSTLQDLYKVKDNFLSNISHELRTPLTSIMGYTELMLDEKLTEKQGHMVEVVFSNSKRLSKLVENLFDSHLIESTNLKLSDDAVVINDIIAVVVEDMKNMSTIKNIPININIPETLVVNGDIEKLTHVFSNILDNAIKFTITGEINIRGEMTDQRVYIQISDTGIGIPQDMLEKIFDRFCDIGSSTVRKYEGTGLGLWTSKNIIDAHDGMIWAESTNDGSTFHILLPKSVKG